MTRAASEVFEKTSFWEKLYLLLIASIVSTVFALLVVDPISQRLAERRESEAALAKARVELYDNLASMYWMLHARTWNVTFYAGRSPRDARAYQSAVDTYQAETALAQGAIRAEVGRARRLISPAIYDRLIDFYLATLLVLDRDIERLIVDDAESSAVDPLLEGRWEDAHNALRERRAESLPHRISAILCALALDLGIAEEQSACGVS